MKRNWNPQTFLGGKEKVEELCWKIVWQFPWKLNINLLFNQVIPLLGINHGEMKTCPHKDLNVNVHSRIIYNGWNLETIQMSISWWINKQDVAYLHNGIQVSNVKEQTTDACYMDEFQNKRLPILLFHLYEMSIKGTFIGTVSRLVVAWRWEGFGALTTNGHEDCFGGKLSKLSKTFRVMVITAQFIN